MTQAFDKDIFIQSQVAQKEFQDIVYKYYRDNRRSFLWRENPLPYYVLLSEIMSQQTQMNRVEKYFNAWIERFPSLEDVARSSFDQVLPYWIGLGYNRRALHLYNAIKIIVQEHNGIIPCNRSILCSLPGIGEYTSGAIMAFAYNQPEIFIETNIRSVFIAHFFQNQGAVHDKEILPLIKVSLDENNPRDWYYALMDYGMHIKKVYKNPNNKSVYYVIQSTFKGSKRECRAAIMKYVCEYKVATFEELQLYLKNRNIDDKYFEISLQELSKEKMLRINENIFIV